MKKWLKNLIILLVFLSIVATLSCIKIKNVEIVGNTKYVESELLAKIIDSDFERYSVVFFLKDKFLKHKNLLYIEQYDIKWVSPFHIVIEVKEKDAVGFVKKDVLNAYFDNTGVIINISNERIDGCPEIRGISFRAYKEGETIIFENKDIFYTMLNITNTLKKRQFIYDLLEFNSIDEIYIYTGKIKVHLGNYLNMDTKLKRLVEIYPNIKDLSGVLDLSSAREDMYDEQYIFRKQ